ncbi:TPA: hypothetical protein JIZ13_04045 [Acinetobacter nosocomialis]|uniref:Uncharacterized protein n=1 Tax=Acinetobacter nosocomialis TaxID=106654 RepID=A0A0A7XJE8_ACINO|nr:MULTISPECIES: hypothetical protein [Acinetobacter]AJB48488.1 hypothetical protein RR32_10305 [Acinetobacter nosocomialis]ARG17234.1 hypothetical protein B7L44_11910 [Acinetobacter nosocomialis]AVF44504.1 hypothetical protein AL533_08945 [Acinetobacter nosocomialis]AWL19470.1 hypothetical protein DIW83_10755 [Acinetobacter nosocomialis]AZC09918.1 hypothetical protein DKE47_011730 [Acinetobacter nosocomialis]
MSHTQLINKGGFRERANRSRKYQQSENKQTALPSNKYQPQTKSEENPTVIAQDGIDNADCSN